MIYLVGQLIVLGNLNITTYSWSIYLNTFWYNLSKMNFLCVITLWDFEMNFDILLRESGICKMRFWGFVGRWAGGGCDGWWFPAITLSQPNYSFGCGCCWCCGYCWAVTIDLCTAQSLPMDVFGLNHFSRTKFNKYWLFQPVEVKKF